MKRIISVILACIILISIGSGGLVSAANEMLLEDISLEEVFEPFSSDFLSSYGGSISRVSSGNLRVNFTVRATRIFANVGALTITIQERNGNSWSSVATYSHSTTSGMMGSNTSSHSGIVNHSGTAGIEYRATITVFAGGSPGDQRSFVTNTVRA